MRGRNGNTVRILAARVVEIMLQKVLIHSSTPLETIRKIFDTKPEEKANGCFIGNCTTEMANQDREIKGFLQNNLNAMQDLFEELVSRGQTEGSINRNKSSKEYAAYLFTALQGLRITGILLTEQKETSYLFVFVCFVGWLLV